MSTRWISLTLLLFTTISAWAAEKHRYVASHVLGTSFVLTVQAPKPEADQIEQLVIQEIKRLEKVFSSYDPHSEVSLLNQKTNSKTPSPELLEMALLCERWRKKFPKAFSCRMGAVIEAWRKLEENQTRPERKAIRDLAKKANLSEYSATDLKTGVINEDYLWNFGAIAKGYILDQALLAAKNASPDVEAIGIDIGGDAVYWQKNTGDPAWQVGLQLPNQLDDSGEHRLGQVGIHNGAIAYSGHGSRSRNIDQRTYGHILKPRDGWPVDQHITAIVRAQTATEADAIATALTVLPVSEGMDWLESHPEYAALLITEQGRHHASSNWYQLGFQNNLAASNRLAEIKFKLSDPDTADYRKPYVAIWMENSSREVVKTLLLLGDSERWMSSNRTWWRRHGKNEPSILDGFSRPTRRPGEYQLSWNGRDDYGQTLSHGPYVLVIEAVREHGGHEILKIPFEFNHMPLKESLQGKEELLSFSFEIFEKPEQRTAMN